MKKKTILHLLQIQLQQKGAYTVSQSLIVSDKTKPLLFEL